MCDRGLLSVATVNKYRLVTELSGTSSVAAVDYRVDAWMVLVVIRCCRIDRVHDLGVACTSLCSRLRHAIDTSGKCY